MSSLAFTAGAWLWDKYGKAVTDKAAGAVKDKWGEIKWKDAAEKYRAKIIELYDSMQIMGMAKPVPLDDIFTDAYMLDKPTAFGRFDIERLKQMSADSTAPQHAERINGLRLLAEKDNLFILGKPGAGKTTFLKYIALQAAKQNIDKVPIFISLKEWADSGLKLMPFVVERFDICDFPEAQPFVEELLKLGDAIVLFDGLDEVNQEDGQRDKQTREINKYIEKYNRTQYLITCRIAASDYTFEPFDYVEIADFTEKQIEKFVGNWFREDKKTRDRFLTDFKKDENKGLRDLSRTPLLLTLLCLAFNETLTFPQRRVEIYEEAIDALLKKWDTSRRIKRDEIYRKLSLGHKENLLARVAWETFKRNEYFIQQKGLERVITDYVKNVPPHDTNEEADGEVILKAVEAQHGIFVERARGVYSFSHLTFQEYFTARYVVDNVTQGALTHLLREHCADARWREVFLLIASLLPDASHVMQTFRRSVDELLEDDDKLRALLAWADKKSVPVPDAPRLARLFYLRLGAYDLNHAVAVSLDPALAGARELGLDLALALALARAIDLSGNPSYYSARDFNGYCAKALEFTGMLGLNELAKELSSLAIPSYAACPATWKVFTRELRALLTMHRDIGRQWDLTETHKERLTNYLNAARLLQDCLELATMPLDEKKVMLNSLYLPPAQAKDEQNA